MISKIHGGAPVTSSISPLSLSPFLPYILLSRRGFNGPTPRRPIHLPSPGQIWCLLTGSSPPSCFPRRYCTVLYCTVRQFWCHGRWYERSDLWIRLAVHRRCHRLCRYNHSTPELLTVSSLTSTVWVHPGREAAEAREQ